MPTYVENGGLTFVCEDPIEIARANSLFTKEPGTIRWLESVHEGDVVYDIGANIGCYTLLAARLVGATGHVYAFEPHTANASELLRNIHYNHLTARVTVMTDALSECEGYAQLFYRSKRPGSSGHQCGTPETFTPAAVEFKHVTSIDLLCDKGVIRRPATHVKIDIDGREFTVLRGMAGQLSSTTPPRSIQTETSPVARIPIRCFLESYGYHWVERHRTQLGEAAVARGDDPDSVTDNAIFTRAA